MNLTPDNLKDLAALPPVLRALLDAELAAGNELTAVEHSHPAAPCGASFKLAQPLLSRPRTSGEGIDYYNRNTSDYSGEITDAKRHFFLLEPPTPPPPEPDMNAIRASLGVAKAGQEAASFHEPVPHETDAAPLSEASAPGSPLAKFLASMRVDYEKWHDGIGYDLDALLEASPDERSTIESILLPRASDDWRDVEALAALDTPAARQALQAAFQRGNHAIRLAVLSHAPSLVSEKERADSLISALNSADIYGGLSGTLDQVAEFHPPEIIDALLRGLLERDGATAVHFAAMLLFIHGKAKSPFDWDHRPFFLKFHTEEKAERIIHYQELCSRIGVEAY